MAALFWLETNMQRFVNIKNLDAPALPPIKAIYCASYVCRLKGLMFHKELARNEGLLLVQPRESRLDASIHMLFVWFDLGIVWLNDKMTVADVCLAKAWRPAYFPKAPARYVLEIRPERLRDFQVGQRIALENA